MKWEGKRRTFATVQPPLPALTKLRSVRGLPSSL